MLSRIAESMFWIGRYVERADDTARLLQVHLRLLAEGSVGSEADGCRNVLALMSVDAPEDQPSQDDLLRLLAWDGNEPSSIVACWAAARDNARRAREVIPLELWQCINTTWRGLPRSLELAGAHTFLEWARERSALFAGLARGTMVRDDGWQFLLLGRSLEQADMTSRLVSSASLPSGTTQWPSVLRGAGGHDAFLRTYRGFHTDHEAAEFLITDARFPRSVMHGLIAASECLRNVSQANPSAGPAGAGQRALGQLRARLEYAPMEELMADLPAEMTEVQDICAEVAEIVSSTFFAAADSRAWTTEGTR